MPTLYYRVESSGVNILKTVTDQVVTGLLDELDLTTLFKNSVYTLQSFTAYSQYDDGEGVPSLNKNRCDIEVDFILDKSQVPWPVETPYTTTAYGVRSDKKGNHTPIFFDPDANILIEHYTVACALDMRFSMTFQTFDAACKTFDTIQSKYKGSLIQTPFDISFSYPVSMGLYKFLHSVYEAKPSYANKDLLDYISDHKVTEISFDVRKSQLTSEDADKELMIRCQQLGCLAQLTMEQKEPEVTRVGQLPDNYKIEFQLVFQFGRPNLIAVHTPVSVNNTVLPYGLFENIEMNFHYSPYVSGVYQDLMCNEYMRRSYGNYRYAAQLIRIPIYDDWFSVDRKYIEHEYRPLIIAHFTLDGTESSIDIKNMDDIELHPVVQDILKEAGNSVFLDGGLFNISVYANDLRLSEDLLSIDDNLILKVRSNRPDRYYHLVISETTNITKTDPVWDSILIKYRYFFPLTIERNLDYLIKKRYFYIDYDNSFLRLISRLISRGRLKSVLEDMVSLGEVTNDIFGYTQNPSQLADFLVFTKSLREDSPISTTTDSDNSFITDSDGSYIIDPTDPTMGPGSILDSYYTSSASVYGRSLFVAFIERCLAREYITLEEIPSQYLDANKTIYPYVSISGGYYGFNTPIRVFDYNIRAERRT